MVEAGDVMGSMLLPKAVTHAPQPEPWLWPTEDLELLNHCPICRSEVRTLLYGDLEDWSFRAAPGQWSLWTCRNCALDYLDPRPTLASIGRAYANYYTHQAPAPDTSFTWRGTVRKYCAELFRRAKEPLRHGYLASEYGHRLQPSWRIGAPLFRAMPLRRLGVELAVRHLPPPSRPGARLLDIGCGDGSFLLEAQRLGYEAHGVDPDANVAINASKRLPNVQQGGFPRIHLPSESFEQITMSHVIEHVHDPVAALGEVRRLLSPRGRLWLATPNIEGATHLLFGKYWRGLEAPRHLYLFSHATLTDLLGRAGFERPQFRLHRPVPEFFIDQSFDPSTGRTRHYSRENSHSAKWRTIVKQIRNEQLAGTASSDIIVCTAHT